MERREPIHPTAPELRQTSRRHDDPAETHDKQEENRHQETGEQFVGSEGGDGLAETDIVKFEEHDAEEREARGKSGNAIADDSPPPAAEVNPASDDAIRDLDDDAGEGECEPGVDLSVILAALENIAAVEEDGLQTVGLGEGRW